MAKAKQKDSTKNSLTSASESPLIEIDETIVVKKREAPGLGGELMMDLPPELEAMFKEKILEKMKTLLGGDILDVFSSSVTEEISDEQKQRISKILKTDDLEVNPENLRKYLNFLKQKVKIPLLVRAEDSFQWEEEYLSQGKSKREYEKLKKSRPCHKDEFHLIKFLDNFPEEDGITVQVLRVNDNREFYLDLSDLEVVDKKSPSYQLIRDYHVWFDVYY